MCRAIGASFRKTSPLFAPCALIQVRLLFHYASRMTCQSNFITYSIPQARFLLPRRLDYINSQNTLLRADTGHAVQAAGTLSFFSPPCARGARHRHLPALRKCLYAPPRLRQVRAILLARLCAPAGYYATMRLHTHGRDYNITDASTL